MCDLNEKIVVGYLHVFSAKGNTSVIISANMTHLDEVDKKKVSENQDPLHSSITRILCHFNSLSLERSTRKLLPTSNT